MKNSKRYFLIFTGLSSLLFLTGCFATQDDVGVLKTQVSALNKTLQDMQKNQAAAGQQMEELTIQLTQSGENLKDFDYKLDGLSTKLDNISTMLVAKSGEKETYQMLPGDIYTEAKGQFDSAKFEAAVKGFNLYIKTAPQGNNIEDAYYYLGQSYFEQKEYQKAAVAAATLLDKFPQSKLTAAVRILYARSIVPLNKKEEAKTYLKSVGQDFKGTPEADKAKQFLGEIK